MQLETNPTTLRDVFAILVGILIATPFGWYICIGLMISIHRAIFDTKE